MIPPFQKQLIETHIDALKDSLTGDMFSDMEAREEIHSLEMQLNGTAPNSGEPEVCEFCSG